MEMTPFQWGWWGTDLPGVRDCDGTYCHFAYDSLPPLNESLFRGEFQWLTPPAETVEAQMAVHTIPEVYEEKIAQQLVALRASAAQAGVTLPDAFLRFMGHAEWQLEIPSCTACYFDLSMVIPSRFEDGAHLVKFYNDQQDVLFWYLYLSPTGESSVICSAMPFDDPELDVTVEQVKAYTVACAPSFEAFLYRLWLENTIWFADDEGRDLTAEEQAYLDHYR